MQDPLIESVLVSLRRVIRATDLHSRELIRTTGMTAPQLLLMQTIRARGEAVIGELAQEMNLSQATVTSIVDRLEQRGYLYREKSSQDKRKVHARLTAQGKAAVKDAPVPLQESFVRQFRRLQPWEQSMIIAALQRVAEMMDAQHLDASPVLDVGMLDRMAETDGAEASGHNARTGRKTDRSKAKAASADDRTGDPSAEAEVQVGRKNSRAKKSARSNRKI